MYGVAPVAIARAAVSDQRSAGTSSGTEEPCQVRSAVSAKSTGSSRSGRQRLQDLWQAVAYEEMAAAENPAAVASAGLAGSAGHSGLHVHRGVVRPEVDVDRAVQRGLIPVNPGGHQLEVGAEGGQDLGEIR